MKSIVMDSLLIKDVLTDRQRKYVLKYSIPLLIEGNEISKRLSNSKIFPGKQTRSNLHELPYFNEIHSIFLKYIRQSTNHDYTITKSWVNWTNGSKKDICWHNHERECKLSAVYYLKTPLPFFSNGTLFRTGLVKTPQNSLLIFPSYMEHTAPSSPFRFSRYTLAMNLM